MTRPYGHGPAWRAGPHRVYRRFAAAALDALTVPLAGLATVDAGCGTGAVAEELVARGATVVCVDRSPGMVREAPAPRVVADIAALPLRDRCVDLAAAGFVLSHVDDPAAVLGELARVTRPGGLVVATGFPAGDTHPVKEAADAVLADAGYRPPEWYLRVKHTGEARAGDLPALARGAGLAVRLLTVDAPLSDLSVEAVSAWRLGMAHIAPFVAASPRRDELAARVEAAVRTAGLAQPVRVVVLVAAIPPRAKP
jgi:SAM-dependent methyltransferase